jgi:hypothetical protein
MKMSFRKIPARHAVIVMPFILSIFMTGLVSLISTLRSIGLADNLLQVWMGSWAMSWVVAFPALLLVLPLVKKITGLLVEQV